MGMSEINKFTVRVYAVIFNGNNEILVSDEYHNKTKMVKFPGGGMEFGEGTIDTLKRESIEEFGQELEVLEHFYTTDFFQQAMFKKEFQVMSIYYKSKFKDPIQFKTTRKLFDFAKLEDEAQSFRWVPVNELNIDEITFPIDKRVAEMLIDELKIKN